jgi:hypothetical protein
MKMTPLSPQDQLIICLTAAPYFSVVKAKMVFMQESAYGDWLKLTGL